MQDRQRAAFGADAGAVMGVGSRMGEGQAAQDDVLSGDDEDTLRLAYAVLQHDPRAGRLDGQAIRPPDRAIGLVAGIDADRVPIGGDRGGGAGRGQGAGRADRQHARQGRLRQER